MFEPNFKSSILSPLTQYDDKILNESVKTIEMAKQPTRNIINIRAKTGSKDNRLPSIFYHI